MNIPNHAIFQVDYWNREHNYALIAIRIYTLNKSYSSSSISVHTAVLVLNNTLVNKIANFMKLIVLQ